MKLWLKVSLLAVIVVTLATAVCSFMLLLRSGQSNLDLAIENALTDQQVRAANWRSAMQSRLEESYSETAQRSLAKYLIGQIGDSGTVLLQGADVICNATAISPEDYLPITAEARQYVIEDIAGRTMLLAGSAVTVKGAQYRVYVVKDVTQVFTGIQELAYSFAAISIAVILAAGAVTVLITRGLLKPIGTLKKNTGLMASGVYDRRVRIAEHDEIGELGEDFNRMADAVEAHIRALRDEAERRTMFMSALTHELKTPMTSIKGNAQTLLATKLTDEEREDALIAIDAACTRVERLSQKLMQLIVLRQSGDLVLSPVPVSELISEVQSACAQQLKRRGLKLIIENDMDTLVMEHDLFSDLLINLIDNAGKASKPGDVIKLSAHGNSIAVCDIGIGIPQNELTKLTQPFYMVDRSRAKREGGVGLGLALCEEIARLHGARLVIESAPGIGTTVSVVFETEGVQNEKAVQ
ncbi:MAG: HAMP domain-containing sensor histidine kinase [Clostridia bacterium]